MIGAGKTCHGCSKLNHYEKLCRSKSKAAAVHQVNEHRCTAGACDYSDSEHSDDEFYINTVYRVSTGSTPDHDRATLHIQTGPNKTPIKYAIDTGSAVNIISHQQFKALNVKHPLEAPTCKLTSYTGNPLSVLGTVKLACHHNNKAIKAAFYVVDTNAPPLIGLQSSIDLGLIKLTYSVERSHDSDTTILDKQTVLAEYGELFIGIGEIPGECKLYLNDEAQPTVNPHVEYLRHSNLNSKMNWIGWKRGK